MLINRPADNKGSLDRKALLLLRVTVLPGLAVLGMLWFVDLQVVRGGETLDAYKLGRDAQQGKKINPVPLNLQGKNPELVYLGSYLVNGHGGCNACHSCPSFKGINPLKAGANAVGASDSPGPVNAANFLGGGTPFPGRGAPYKGSVLSAPNLTPDSSGLPGGLTYEEFKNAMQNGSVPAMPGHILQVMPWPQFRHLYENDLAAIYEYLSAIPSAKPGICTGDGQTGN